MNITRRRLIETIVAAPVGAAAAACWRSRLSGPAAIDILRPPPSAARALGASPVVDVHAHFFNASDVPIRGFVEDCLGHSAHPIARRFLKAVAPIADRLAGLAPTAASELASLTQMLEGARLRADAAARVEGALGAERDDAARRVVEAIRGSEFEQLYREATADRVAAPGPADLTDSYVKRIVRASEVPLPPPQQALAARSASQPQADIADGMMGFLHYMLSSRWANVQAYKAAYTTHPNAFGIDTVLGVLVDFDYWLDRKPRSPQDDQVLLHKLIRDLNGPYFRPVVAYNPWSDINEAGAGLARVIRACSDYGFAAVKIYPPMGFRPAGNATSPGPTQKPRPDLRQLDATLARFFGECADRRIPIIAHTARSNGRDAEHDDFGGPAGWQALLTRHAAAARTPVIDFGHFGGGAGTTWTQDFAELMGRRRDIALYSDLGYWDELVCPESEDEVCRAGRARLQQAMRVEVGPGATVADRTMFATDWLMLSQMKRWADYPARVLDSVRSIAASEQEVRKVFGLNASRCFNLQMST